MLAENGAVVDAVDDRGRTPMHAAAIYGAIPTANLLYDKYNRKYCYLCSKRLQLFIRFYWLLFITFR